MKKTLLLLSIFVLIPMLVNGQMWVIHDFDAAYDSTVYTIDEASYLGNDSIWIDTTYQSETAYQGGAITVDWQNLAYDQYGGWIGLNHSNPDSQLYDFSVYDSISLMFNNIVPQNKTGKVHFRIILNEWDEASTQWGDWEVWISHHLILDDAPGWQEILTPLIAYEDPDVQNLHIGPGFWAPLWSGITGNGKLDLDRIAGWRFEWSQDGTLFSGVADRSVHGTIIFDELALKGLAPAYFVMFNGKFAPGNVTMRTGWSGSVEVTQEEDAAPEGNTGSVKLSNSASWDGVEWVLSTAKNMMFAWTTDSLQFKIKADAGVGDMNIQFWHRNDDDPATADVKEDRAYTANYLLTEEEMGYDGTWKQVKIKLSDFNRYNGVWDGDSNATIYDWFDSTKVEGLRITNNGQSWDGTVIYFDDVWTGNPVFDWVPPAQVSGVMGVPQEYYNVVFWDDLTDEKNETYDVYAYTEPITEITDVLEVVAKGVQESEAVGGVAHRINYPLEDQLVTYYYAVIATDEAGNKSEQPGVSSAVENTGKGVPTFALMSDFNFAADGDPSEWTDSEIMPWEFWYDPTPGAESPGTVALGAFDGPDDMTATIYGAFDEDNLYVYCDIIDDVYSYSDANVGTWWTGDAFEFYIGLWDQNGKAIHSSNVWLNRGAEPDYKLVFLGDRYVNEYKNSALIGEGDWTPEFTPEDDNYFFAELGGGDYIIEARIPLDSIAFDDGTNPDVRFQPERGIRLMFDLVMHDNDTQPGQEENNLAWSPNNVNTAYMYQREWTYTWIGDTTHKKVSGIDDRHETVYTYYLEQNYPNPFNPTTTIEYSIAKTEKVKVQIINILGQVVKTVVDERQVAGIHKVEFDASNLSSGIYFYSIKTDNFLKTKKMVLLK
jgi:hypothetical protein